jgi:uncharacterized membrane protein YheB (UPF0754 family)
VIKIALKFLLISKTRIFEARESINNRLSQIISKAVKLINKNKEKLDHTIMVGRVEDLIFKPDRWYNTFPSRPEYLIVTSKKSRSKMIKVEYKKN